MSSERKTPPQPQQTPQPQKPRLVPARTVAELRELLRDLPDDTPLVVETFDHGYRQAVAIPTLAEFDQKTRSLHEYWPSHTNTKATGVVLIR